MVNRTEENIIFKIGDKVLNLTTYTCDIIREFEKVLTPEQKTEITPKIRKIFEEQKKSKEEIYKLCNFMTDK